ncbi:hypothetical protein PTTG_26100 [Puccinia triticina 1-1 BBBD Race 1]|uniref:Uncharacterized protein n=1 Tax=Puccinia triticina (isolate 1-1 / race 1 (BBBD)) TaxID=630390 RepID=A0A180GWR1_PUCT1|nr:hypothetical protein PTTG_26100 [Puccinia triticina 1-1 BBBD Race 1]
MSNSIFTSVIKNSNEQDPYLIWQDIKTIYASDSLLSVFQVWNKWLDIQFDQDMNTYISQMEEILAESSSIGLKVPDKLIGCGIVSQITKKRPVLMQALFADLKALAKPKEIIAKLWDIGQHEFSTKRKLVEEAEESTSTALVTGTSQRGNGRPKRSGGRGPIIRCSGGVHNLKATTHVEADCWTINPSSRPAN